MRVLTSFELIDYQELNDQQLVDVIKYLCEFDDIKEPYLIDIQAKSFSYKNRTIVYNINILDLSDAP